MTGGQKRCKRRTNVSNIALRSDCRIKQLLIHSCHNTAGMCKVFGQRSCCSHKQYDAGTKFRFCLCLVLDYFVTQAYEFILACTKVKHVVTQIDKCLNHSETFSTMSQMLRSLVKHSIQQQHTRPPKQVNQAVDVKKNIAT